MKENKEEYYTLGQIITNAKAYLHYLCTKWVWLVTFCIAGAGIGFCFYKMQQPKYEAECTFIIEEKQSGLGGLSGIASQFGFDIGSMSGGGGMFAGDNILDILMSKVILNKILLTKIDSSTNSKTLADIYLELSGLKTKWSQDDKLSNISFANVNRVSDVSLLQDSVLNIVYDGVVKKHLSVERISKKGTIIRAKVVSINPDFSKLLVKRLVYGSKDYYVAIKTSVTSANVARLQKKADSLSALLNNKSFQVAQVQINDPNPALKFLQVPTEIASRDKTVLATLYSEVIKNLEVAKTTLMLQTPVLEVLDVPSLSLYDNKKGKLFFMIIGAFVLTSLYSIISLFRFINIKQVHKS